MKKKTQIYAKNKITDQLSEWIQIQRLNYMERDQKLSEMNSVK